MRIQYKTLVFDSNEDRVYVRLGNIPDASVVLTVEREQTTDHVDCEVLSGSAVVADFDLWGEYPQSFIDRLKKDAEREGVKLEVIEKEVKLEASPEPEEATGEEPPAPSVQDLVNLLI